MVLLKPVTIEVSRLEDFAAGTVRQQLDSVSMLQYANGSLTAILQNESPLYIKSYGPGSLASGSFRGSTAAQTAVLWNGFNLNSPLYGQVDFSLLPILTADQIEVVYGGKSTLWGSGAMAGAILLNNVSKFNQGLVAKASTSMGSFNENRQAIELSGSTKNWNSSLKVFRQQADNDFTFYNSSIANNPKSKQINAAFKQNGLLAENYFLLNTHQKLNFFFWYDNSDRQIPPSLLQTINHASQQDEHFRVSSQWQYDGKKSAYMIRAAMFKEKLLYRDDFLSASNSHAATFISEAEAKFYLAKRQYISVGLHQTFINTNADNFANNVKEKKYAFFAAYSLKNASEKLMATCSIRKEWLANYGLPLVYASGLTYVVAKWISLNVNGGKIYRNPTLNDLYWQPGGNALLKPETGWTIDAGLPLSTKITKKTSFEVEPVFFIRKTENQIIWLPVAGYWSPQNLLEVWSRGIETKSELKTVRGDFNFILQISTSYVVSTNEKSKSESDASVHKQLMYVPLYSGHSHVTLRYKQWLMRYQFNYTGYRYTTTDNSEFINPYSLSNLYVAFDTLVKKMKLNVFFQLNNIFNERYQVMANRAMPLINYHLGLTLLFQQKTK